MDLVHKGLEAMQALQAQTARAHEKFLETQAQASQTLAAMMTQTRQFADGIDFLAAPHFMPAREPLPDRSTAPNPPAVGSRNVRPHVPPPLSNQHPMPAKVNGKALPVRTAFPDPSETALSTPSNSSALTTGPAASIFSAPASKIQTVLFEIVSRLTGFPEEMLEPDMDIESDLGVDSIKK